MMPVFHPCNIQLKSRGHEGTRITADGYADNEISGDVVGRSLSGTRFSGRRCSVPLVQSLLPPVREVSDISTVQEEENVDDINRENPKKSKSVEDQGKLADHPNRDFRSRVMSPKSRRRQFSKSAPLLTSVVKDADDRSILKDESDFSRRGRRMSDTLTMGLAVFRKQKQIRAAGRRMSEIYSLSKVND